MSDLEHEMICWNCHGSGVVASEDAKPIRCPLCRDDYGRLKVVPASQLARACKTMVRCAEKLESFGNEEPAAVASHLRDVAHAYMPEAPL